VTCVVGTLWLVSNGAVVAGMISGFFTVGIFKLSELFSLSSLSRGQKAMFVAKVFVAQIVSFACFMSYVMSSKDPAVL
jgi:hypothetical protein